MSRGPVILFDVDGPLTRGFFGKACEFLRAEGVPAHPDAIDRWNIFESFGASKEIERRVRERLCLPGIAREFPVRAGAGPLLRSLRTWADVYAVTAPLDGSPTWAHDRERWLCDCLGFTPSRVISARDKTPIAGDALVEDKIETLDAWQAKHPGGLAIAWHESHNARDAWVGPRVRGYDELAEYLETIRR
jgi:5'(3')-deoxyribonucleotidase